MEPAAARVLLRFPCPSFRRGGSVGTDTAGKVLFALFRLWALLEQVELAAIGLAFGKCAKQSKFCAGSSAVRFDNDCESVFFRFHGVWFVVRVERPRFMRLRGMAL
jgi:hypothetical protein